MTELTEFEQQRQENIRRNKELLQQLDLGSLSNSIKNEIPRPKGSSGARRKRDARPVKREVQEPSRKSRRLAGVKMEDTEEGRRMQQEFEERERRRKEVERLKQTKLFGNFHLIDLVTDKRLGSMKFEHKVMANGGQGGSDGIKQEEGEQLLNEVDDLDIDKDNRVLNTLKELGDKFSAGDFYELIRESLLGQDDKQLEEKRRDFDNLKLYSQFNPADIKITHQRITAMNFHPATENRIITAGDKVGNLGIWAIDSDSEKEVEEPTITILKPHGKSISKILTPFTSPSKIISSAYDGSVRQLDLNKLESSELVYLLDPFESTDIPLAVSDINMNMSQSPDILYMSTLAGNLYMHDLRVPFKTTKSKSLMRLHDKKIGGFSINPNNCHEIATASLDRSLRVWDLRNVSSSNAFWSEFDDQVSPLAVNSYNSRLSISCVDWNTQNRLVCNGYDDKINIFDVSGGEGKNSIISQWSLEATTKKPKREETEELTNSLTPINTIKHNCQTGRWVSILKSKWQASPKDGVQKFVIANMNRGMDVYDQKGQLLAHLTDAEVSAVPAVTTFHPTENWCVGGSASGKLYLFE